MFDFPIHFQDLLEDRMRHPISLTKIILEYTISVSGLTKSNLEKQNSRNSLITTNLNHVQEIFFGQQWLR